MPNEEKECVYCVVHTLIQIDYAMLKIPTCAFSADAVSPS